MEKGNSILAVKKHANWSLNSNTFEDYYYKPHNQSSDSTLINNSIFYTEKSITSEVGVEATGIVEQINRQYIHKPRNSKQWNLHFSQFNKEYT